MVIKERYTVPNNRLDHAPFGTLYKVFKTNVATHYIQISNVKNKYEWIQIGAFFERVFSKDINDKEFINGCLTMLKKL